MKPDHSGGVRFESNHINGPALGQGVQINLSSAYTPASVPLTAAERRSAAGRAMLDSLLGAVCKGAWGVCGVAPALGLFVLICCLRATGAADTLLQGVSAVLAPSVLLLWWLDLAFFRWRRRLEARGIGWLTGPVPVHTAVMVGGRLMLVVIMICVHVFLLAQPPIWFGWL